MLVQRQCVRLVLGKSSFRKSVGTLTILAQDIGSMEEIRHAYKFFLGHPQLKGTYKTYEYMGI